MEDYKERLKTEFKELREKIAKLSSFIYRLEVEQYIGQRDLLQHQYYAMCDYLIILEKRAKKEDIKLE